MKPISALNLPSPERLADDLAERVEEIHCLDARKHEAFVGVKAAESAVKVAGEEDLRALTEHFRKGEKGKRPGRDAEAKAKANLEERRRDHTAATAAFEAARADLRQALEVGRRGYVEEATKAREEARLRVVEELASLEQAVAEWTSAAALVRWHSSGGADGKVAALRLAGLRKANGEPFLFADAVSALLAAAAAPEDDAEGPRSVKVGPESPRFADDAGEEG